MDPNYRATVKSRRRRFVSISRHQNPDGSHTLDAICEEGRAWWLVLGIDEAPLNWTESLQLPKTLNTQQPPSEARD
jgi:hypothetical protein